MCVSPWCSLLLAHMGTLEALCAEPECTCGRCTATTNQHQHTIQTQHSATTQQQHNNNNNNNNTTTQQHTHTHTHTHGRQEEEKGFFPPNLLSLVLFCFCVAFLFYLYLSCYIVLYTGTTAVGVTAMSSLKSTQEWIRGAGPNGWMDG